MAARMRMSEALDLYVREGAALRKAPATLKADRYVLGMLVQYLNDPVLVSLTPEDVRRWFYGPQGVMDEHVSASFGVRLRKAVSPATHNHYRSRVKCFLTWCADEGYVKRNDYMRRIKPMKINRAVRQRPAPHLLLDLLDAAAGPRERAFIATALNTALRSNEIAGMRVGQVNLDDGFIHVIISKTGTEDEQPISSDLDVEIRRWLVAYQEEIGRPLNPEDYLFPNREGGQISHYDEDRNCIRVPMRTRPDRPITNTHRVVQAAMAKIGLPTFKEGTHTIRRAVARAYFDEVAKEKGDVAALRETAALLHHDSLATTEAYLGTTPEKENRNRRIKGQPFLTAMVSQENVVQLPLRPVAEGE